MHFCPYLFYLYTQNPRKDMNPKCTFLSLCRCSVILCSFLDKDAIGVLLNHIKSSSQLLNMIHFNVFLRLSKTHKRNHKRDQIFFFGC